MNKNIISLHDQNLLSINIDFNLHIMSFLVQIFNEEKKDYESKSFEFYDIEDLNSEEFALKELTSLDIYSFETLPVGDKNTAKFVFLLGVSMPSLTITFIYSRYTIKDGY